MRTPDPAEMARCAVHAGCGQRMGQSLTQRRSVPSPDAALDDGDSATRCPNQTLLIPRRNFLLRALERPRIQRQVRRRTRCLRHAQFAVRRIRHFRFNRQAVQDIRMTEPELVLRLTIYFQALDIFIIV